MKLAKGDKVLRGFALRKCYESLEMLKPYKFNLSFVANIVDFEAQARRRYVEDELKKIGDAEACEEELEKSRSDVMEMLTKMEGLKGDLQKLEEAKAICDAQFQDLTDWSQKAATAERLRSELEVLMTLPPPGTLLEDA